MRTPLLNIADQPATAVTPDTNVKEAVDTMVDKRVGAVAVVEGNTLVGIFTERDVMTKVIHRGLDPAATPVGAVMVADPVAVEADTPRSEALQHMLDKHFRHLPLVDSAGTLVGMVSIRNLLNHQFERLQGEVSSLEQYLGADGIGG